MLQITELPTWTTYSDDEKVQVPVLIQQKYQEVPMGQPMIPTGTNDDIIRFQVDYREQLTYISLPYGGEMPRLMHFAGYREALFPPTKAFDTNYRQHMLPLIMTAETIAQRINQMNHNRLDDTARATFGGKLGQPMTREEMTVEFARQLAATTQYWHDQPCSRMDALTGLMHSTLTLFNGQTGNMPGMALLVHNPEENMTYDKSRGKNYFVHEEEIFPDQLRSAYIKETKDFR